MTSKNTFVEKVKADHPITLEGLFFAHQGDSVKEYLEGQYTWFKKDTGKWGIAYFYPVKISNFSGLLCYDRLGFSFRTSDYPGSKKEAYDTLRKHSVYVDFSQYLQFIDSLAEHHRTTKREEDTINGYYKIVLDPGLGNLSVYSVEYRKKSILLHVTGLK